MRPVLCRRGAYLAARSVEELDQLHLRPVGAARGLADHVDQHQRRAGIDPARKTTGSGRSRSWSTPATTSTSSGRARTGERQRSHRRDAWISYLTARARRSRPTSPASRSRAKNMKTSVQAQQEVHLPGRQPRPHLPGQPAEHRGRPVRHHAAQGQADPGEAGRVPGEGRAREVQLPDAADPLLAAVGRGRAVGHDGRHLPRHVHPPDQGQAAPGNQQGAQARDQGQDAHAWSASRSRSRAWTPRAGPR